MDLGKHVGVVYVVLKKDLTLSIMKFCGSNHTFLTEGNLQGSIELTKQSKI